MQNLKEKNLALYKHYYEARDFERLSLFKLLAKDYNVKSALYAGSYIHITPSFVFPLTVYVDTDKKAKAFFNDTGLNAFIKKHKSYIEETELRFHSTDYQEKVSEPTNRFDLLISQYAGFVSQHCKSYLKLGGLLLVNDSHGDASMAYLDNDYQLSASVQQTKAEYQISKKNLESYFIPKAATPITKVQLKKTQRGVTYTKSATAYLFKRIA